MKFIGVAGQFAQGKDVLADFLQTKIQGEWTRAAFGDAVKKVFEFGFGVDRQFIEEWKRNPEPPPGLLMNIRQSLQFIGDGFRKVKDRIWIEIALKGEENLILADCRYFNEAKTISERNGAMIVLYRPGFLNDDPNPSESQIRKIVDFCIKYVPEGPIPKNLKNLYGDECPDEIEYYDYFFKNDGSVEDMFVKAERDLVPFLNQKFTTTTN